MEIKVKARPSPYMSTDIESGSPTIAASEPGSPQYLLKTKSAAEQTPTPEPLEEWDTTWMTLLGCIRIPFGEAVLLFSKHFSSLTAALNKQAERAEQVGCRAVGLFSLLLSFFKYLSVAATGTDLSFGWLFLIYIWTILTTYW